MLNSKLRQDLETVKRVIDRHDSMFWGHYPYQNGPACIDQMPVADVLRALLEHLNLKVSKQPSKIAIQKKTKP